MHELLPLCTIAVALSSVISIVMKQFMEIETLKKKSHWWLHIHTYTIQVNVNPLKLSIF